MDWSSVKDGPRPRPVPSNSATAGSLPKDPDRSWVGGTQGSPSPDPCQQGVGLLKGFPCLLHDHLHLWPVTIKPLQRFPGISDGPSRVDQFVICPLPPIHEGRIARRRSRRNHLPSFPVVAMCWNGTRGVVVMNWSKVKDRPQTRPDPRARCASLQY